MTSEDIRSELEKSPFVPFRLHLASGTTIDVLNTEVAWMMQNTVLIFQADSDASLYDLIALRNIERLEQLGQSPLGSRS